MSDMASTSIFNIKNISEIIANLTGTEPKYAGGSNSSIIVFEYQDPPGYCRNHSTVVPFLECMKSNSRHKRIAADETISGHISRNEISFFTSGVTYEIEWYDPLNYTLLAINPSFFSRFFDCNSFDTFSILFDKLADDQHIRSLITTITQTALNPHENYSSLSYIDDQATALISHLSYKYFGLNKGKIKKTLKHNFNDLKNWIDYKIEMGEDIRLENILDFSGITDPREFLSLFKNSIGMPLYVYCMEREIEIYKEKHISVSQKINRSDILNILKIIDKKVRENDNYENFNLNKEIETILFKTQDAFVPSFKFVFGKTPEQFYYILRLEKAKYLLINTSKILQEIANLCGFNNEDSFRKAFNNYAKMSPTKFRKKFSCY
jgi:glycerol-3-phosphate cytidylyltransferase-like family protein